MIIPANRCNHDCNQSRACVCYGTAPSQQPAPAMHQGQGGQSIHNGQTIAIQPDPKDGWQWLTDLLWIAAACAVASVICGFFAALVTGWLLR